MTKNRLGKKNAKLCTGTGTGTSTGNAGKKFGRQKRNGEKKELKAEQRKVTKRKKKFTKEVKASNRKLKSLRKKALQSQKKLDKLESGLEAYSVITLASGTVMQVNASEGQKVKKGQKLVLIEDAGSVELQFMMKSADAANVPELPLVQIGDVVTEGYRSSIKRKGKRAMVTVIVAVGLNQQSLNPGTCALVERLGPTTLEVTEDILLLEDAGEQWVWGLRDQQLVRIIIDEITEVDNRRFAVLEPGMKPGEMEIVSAIEGIDPLLFDEGTEYSFAGDDGIEPDVQDSETESADDDTADEPVDDEEEDSEEE